jgi:hypothetical protein
MRTADILKEIERLPVSKRIYIIEKAIHSIRTQGEKSELRKAADVLLQDYQSDKDLTAFTQLDFESFYETR